MMIDINEQTVIAIKAATGCLLKSKEYKCNATFICDYHSQSPKQIEYEQAAIELLELLDTLSANR